MKKAILLLGLMICMLSANSSNYQSSGMEGKDFYQVSIHILFMGTPPDSALVTLGDSSIWTYNGYATFYVEDGIYLLTVAAEGYYTLTGGGVNVIGGNVTVEVPLYPILYGVTFFVNCCGEPLANFPITYEGITVMTNAAGFAILNMPAGFYSFEIGGVPITFTVPDTVYVPVDICSEVTFQITSQGMPIVGVSVNVDGETLVTNPNGVAVFCLQNGIHAYIITHPDIEPLTGEFIVNNSSMTLIFDFYEPSTIVTFNLSPLPCNNSFDDITIGINGQNIPPGGSIILSWGVYIFEVFINGCSIPIATGSVTVESVPVTIIIDLPTLPQVTFHVTDQWGADFQDAPVCVDGDILITDNSGLVSFCLTGGMHPYWVANPSYDTIFENLIFECADTTLTVILITGSVNTIEETSLKIYPNPSTGKFYFETPNQITEPIEITVLDLTGRKVYKETEIVTGKTEINLSDQPKGMYFVMVKSGNELLTRKLVIQ